MKASCHFWVSACWIAISTGCDPASATNAERVQPLEVVGRESNLGSSRSLSADATANNYAEALQKSLYFYDAQKSGKGVSGGRLEWRGDSEIADSNVPLQPRDKKDLGTNMSQTFIDAHRFDFDPFGIGVVNLSGGFHDGSSHVKFGLPQSYTASTLGWGLYEFRDAFVATGLEGHLFEELKWFADYFLRSTFRDTQGKVIAFAYQVGEGSIENSAWAPPEVVNLPRPAYFATPETPASDQAAGAAAALALMYLNYENIYASYAAKCLDTAQALYGFAVANRGLGYSGGYYDSSDDNDELAWAAIWLYTATKEESYLQDIIAISADGYYTGYLKKIMSSTQENWRNSWVHSWDMVWSGVLIQLAKLFPDHAQFDYAARWNLEFWSGGAIKHEDASDGEYLSYTPGGFGVISPWGSARYNTAAQLYALIYGKHKGRTDFAAWAKTQMDYLMGDNPSGYSYIVGYPSPERSAKHPHHQAAHGSTTNNMMDPPNHRHVLWGALVGGPDSRDRHRDQTTEIVLNDVACDYNAGLVGALAGLCIYYGADQQPLASFPPTEPPETAYWVTGKIDKESNQGSKITLTVNAIPSHPPHLVQRLALRYFFDVTELIDAGQDIDAVSAVVTYDEQAAKYQGAVRLSGPIAWDTARNTFYVEIDWPDIGIYGKREVQFALLVEPDLLGNSHWDPLNDWSRQDLNSTATANALYAPVFLDGVQVAGSEP